MSDTPLYRLAARAGLARDWTDANDRPQRVSDDALRGVLQGLGFPAEDDATTEQSLALLDQAEDSEHLPPLLTVDVHAPLSLDRWFQAGSRVRCVLEDGSVRTLALDAQARLPGDLPLGYHRLEIET